MTGGCGSWSRLTSAKAAAAGAYGRMQPAPGLERELAKCGVAIEVLPTAKAVDRINALL